MALPDVPLTTLVEFQIREETTDMKEWLAVWAPRARDALLGEPETSGYIACTNLEEPSRVLIYERYDEPVINNRDVSSDIRCY